MPSPLSAVVIASLVALLTMPSSVASANCTGRSSTGIYASLDLSFHALSAQLLGQQIRDGDKHIGVVREGRLARSPEGKLRIDIDLELQVPELSGTRLGIRSDLSLRATPRPPYLKVTLDTIGLVSCSTKAPVAAIVLDPVCQALGSVYLETIRGQLQASLQQSLEKEATPVTSALASAGARLRIEVCGGALGLLAYTGELLPKCIRVSDLPIERHGAQLTAEIVWRRDECKPSKGQLNFTLINADGNDTDDWVAFEVWDYDGNRKLYNTQHLKESKSDKWSRPLSGLENVRIRVGMWDPGFLGAPGSGGGELFFTVPKDGTVTAIVRRRRN